jgi:uncharacterized protein (TIGR04255 family)
MERFVPAYHDAVRGDYPHRYDLVLQQMQVEFGSNGVNLRQIPLTVWQFSSPDRKWAFVLSSDALTLHTIAYEDNQTFVEKFRYGLSKLVAVPEIGIAWTNSVAMRYLDLVATKEDEGLDRLLKPSVLPPPFTDVADLNIVEGVYIAQYKAPKAAVRFQILRNPMAVLPPDLNTPLIQFNNWRFERPNTEFAVVDTDCSTPITEATPMDVGIVCNHMYDLRFVAKSIFEKIGTEYAEKLWKGEA